MTREPLFLSVDHVLAIHRRVIREFGGDPSVRDAGLLASAVAMPAARFEGRFLHEGIPDMAAAYLFHICRSRPFLDGNNRTALAVAEVFLLVNGMELTASNDDLLTLTRGVAAGELSKEDVTRFFRKHTKT